ncbi:AP-2 complex subunit mu [Turnera subulata]|uniref:AP-2 complex subunit mu n=1 Tax=Turnera subulata TaxID=218843 RepID=A0A9Q0JNW9_9ROSI|nr:AP-2 complex subunit mu [Turnera subulata]
MFALGVVIEIPVPKQTAKTSFQVTSGRAKYKASIDCIVWKIRKFPGQTEPTISAEIELISTMTEKKSWTKPPIQMEFQVPMFTASGLCVRFLKVDALKFGRKVGTIQSSGFIVLLRQAYTRLGARDMECLLLQTFG